MSPVDPHSYTDSSHPLTKHIQLSLYLDFHTKIVQGTATLTLWRGHKGEIFLDSKDLTVASVEDSTKRPLKFHLQKPDAVKGSLLRIFLEFETSEFSIFFKTSPLAAALQWLDPSQTTGGKLPYVYTQCQTIHARSVFPCQDTPSARISYTAYVNVPKELSVVMSAAHVERLKADEGTRAIEHFVMDQPIPPYLFALAAGDIAFEAIGPRTKVSAEPSVVHSAASEFAEIENTLTEAEALFGPYEWETFNILVMPPSFPCGGMENPRMAFLTPTIIAGDRSGLDIVFHELAHSWTGNLVTNATYNDAWLNEGITTYAERRIIELKYGKERAALHIAIGWQVLADEIERFQGWPEMTKLRMNLEAVDLDEIFTRVPYEKGFLFLRRLEGEVGRSVFDDFLRTYIAKFRFQSIDTETFLFFLKEKLPQIEEKVDLRTWVYGTGIPDDAKRPTGEILEKVWSLADGFISGSKLKASDTEKWQAQEWAVYLKRLPKNLNAGQIAELETCHRFSESKNWEIKVAFLTIGAYSSYRPLFPAIEATLQQVDRLKYLHSLYGGLLSGSKEGSDFARRVFGVARGKYHPRAQIAIEGLLAQYP